MVIEGRHCGWQPLLAEPTMGRRPGGYGGFFRPGSVGLLGHVYASNLPLKRRREAAAIGNTTAPFLAYPVPSAAPLGFPLFKRASWDWEATLDRRFWRLRGDV